MYDIGKEMILSAVNIEESLVELLKTDIRKTRKLIQNNKLDDIEDIHSILKDVLYILILTNEKMKMGFDIINQEKNLLPFE